MQRFEIYVKVLTQTKKKEKGRRRRKRDFFHFYNRVEKDKRVAAGESLLITKRLSRNIKNGEK